MNTGTRGTDLLTMAELAVQQDTENQTEDVAKAVETTATLSMSESEGSDKRSSLCFLRTSDLSQLCSSLTPSTEEELKEHGVIEHQDENKDEKKGKNKKEQPTVDERWIALDEASPDNVKKVTEELVRYSLHLEDMAEVWTPDKKTQKAINNGGKVNERDVWMWIGKVPHFGYGHDIPCVKSSGLVNMSPKDLAALLLDSTKVKDYNRSSQGRSDRWVWQEDVDEDGEYGKGETKVTRSTNKAPLMRRLLEFVCLLHGRRLDDGSYLVVARTVSGPVANANDHPTVRNEILLNVHLLKAVEGNPDQTEMVNINHLKSPLVPMMVAKKVGLASASGFINDIRGLCK